MPRTGPVSKLAFVILAVVDIVDIVDIAGVLNRVASSCFVRFTTVDHPHRSRNGLRRLFKAVEGITNALKFTELRKRIAKVCQSSRTSSRHTTENSTTLHQPWLFGGRMVFTAALLGLSCVSTERMEAKWKQKRTMQCNEFISPFVVALFKWGMGHPS